MLSKHDKKKSKFSDPTQLDPKILDPNLIFFYSNWSENGLTYDLTRIFAGQPDPNSNSNNFVKLFFLGKKKNNNNKIKTILV